MRPLEVGPDGETIARFGIVTLLDGPLGQIDSPVSALLVFSSELRGNQYQDTNGVPPKSEGWACLPISADLLGEILSEYQGRATEVAFDPGSVLVKIQPIQDFVNEMHLHVFDPDKE